MKSRPTLFAVLVVVLGVSACCTWDSGSFPEITGGFPRDGETDVRRTMHVEIHFTKDMDEQACQDAFSLNPPVPGQFSWPNPKTMKFTPTNPFEPNTTYSVNVGLTAADQKGNYLKDGYHASFTTGE